MLNRQGQYKTTSLSSRLEQWMHRKVASDLAPGLLQETLEIGAGTLNHLKYEHGIASYDVVEPLGDLYKGSPEMVQVRSFYEDVADIPDTVFYDRILSIAVFEHIPDLPVLLSKAVLHLKPAGSLRIAIPNEGSYLWRLGTLITGMEFRKKYRLNYQILMQYEHLNTAREIETLLRMIFKKVERQ
jgi:SAM-dependent methyltransferase